MSEVDAPVPGRLSIRGLRCPGRHGAYPGEQDVERVFLVDVEVNLDIGPAARSDDLAAALDFALLAALIRRAVASPPRALLEAVVYDAARAVLEAFPTVDAVRVRIVKPNPQGLAAAEESAEVSLRRPR